MSGYLSGQRKVQVDRRSPNALSTGARDKSGIQVYNTYKYTSHASVQLAQMEAAMEKAEIKGSGGGLYQILHAVPFHNMACDDRLKFQALLARPVIIARRVPHADSLWVDHLKLLRCGTMHDIWSLNIENVINWCVEPLQFHCGSISQLAYFVKRLFGNLASVAIYPLKAATKQSSGHSTNGEHGNNLHSVGGPQMMLALQLLQRGIWPAVQAQYKELPRF